MDLGTLVSPQRAGPALCVVLPSLPGEAPPPCPLQGDTGNARDLLAEGEDVSMALSFKEGWEIGSSQVSL